MKAAKKRAAKPKKRVRKIGASAPKKHRINERSKANLKPAWQPGQSGNPAGRVKGSRNKLDEDYLASVCALYDECGDEIIREAVRRNPDAFVRMIQSLIPKKVEVEGTVKNYVVRMPSTAADMKQWEETYSKK